MMTAGFEDDASLLAAVETLGPLLTSEDDQQRKSALLSLYQAVSRNPSRLTVTEWTLLASFFTARIADRACITTALEGCLLLLNHNSSISTGADHNGGEGDTLRPVDDMLAALVVDFPIRSLSHGNRALALQLLLKLIQGHGGRILADRPSFLDAVLQAVEGERDPRCLLSSFDLVAATTMLYLNADAKSQEIIRACLEDVCDSVACYFPVTFRVQPSDMHGVTRDGLAASLQHALTCAQEFAPFVMPLCLDKLSSSIWRAKQDSLLLLEACFKNWPPDAYASLISRVWFALKREISEPLDPPTASEKDSAVLALQTLKSCLLAESQWSLSAPSSTNPDPQGFLLSKVMQDDLIVDLPQTLLEIASAGESMTAAKQIALTSRLLAAICGASGTACQAASTRLLPQLLAHMNEESHAACRAALTAVAAILDGASELTGIQGPVAGVAASDTSSAAQSDWGPKILAALPKSSVGGTRGSTNLLSEALHMKIFARLASLAPGQLLSVGPESQQHIVQKLIEHATEQDSSAESAKDLASALGLIAGAQHATEYCRSGFPFLQQALESAATDAEASTPLLSLSHMAQANRDLALGILQLTQKVILKRLQEGNTLNSLLVMLREVILPSLQDEALDSAAESLTCLVTGILNHSKTVRELDLEEETLVGLAILGQTATSLSSAEQQQHIAQFIDDTILGLDGQGSANAGMVVACACRIALRPGVRSQTRAMDVLRIVLQDSLKATSDFSEVKMACAASMLLKWPSAGAKEDESLDYAVAFALEEHTLPNLQLQIEKDDGAQTLRAMNLLGWLTKALAMRQHLLRFQPLETAIAFLEAASLDLVTVREELKGEDESLEVDGYAEDAEIFDAKEAVQMARVFSTVMSEGSGLTQLSAINHCQGTLLWQQKMFTFMFTKLEEKIKEGQEYLGGPPEPLLLALIHAIAPTPDNIVKLFSARMLPWCIQCVSLLMQEPLNDAQAVRDALGVLKQSLEHEPGRKLLEPSLGELVSAILSAAVYQSSIDVRLEALKCMSLLRSMPYTLLHPHRPAVLAVLSKAIDDGKRTVRSQACRTRHLWSI